jgi:hypothetical protein
VVSEATQSTRRKKPMSVTRALRKFIALPTEPKISEGSLSSDDEQDKCVSNDASTRLDRILLDRDARDDLVHQLLAGRYENHAVLKVRLLCAINEVLRTNDKRIRQVKASKIITWFIREDSKYYIGSIPRPTQSDLFQLEHNAFILLKNIVSSELVELPLVAQMLSEA